MRTDDSDWTGPSLTLPVCVCVCGEMARTSSAHQLPWMGTAGWETKFVFPGQLFPVGSSNSSISLTQDPVLDKLN